MEAHKHAQNHKNTLEAVASGSKPNTKALRPSKEKGKQVAPLLARRNEIASGRNIITHYVPEDEEEVVLCGAGTVECKKCMFFGVVFRCCLSVSIFGVAFHDFSVASSI